MTKDADEQPREEICRGRPGRVLSAGGSVLVELGFVILQVWMCSGFWKLSEAHTVEILWKLPHIGIINY